MQYVKVTGNNHAEALKNLRESYGSDVIIFREKWVSPKTIFSKIIGKKSFLIEAAIRERKDKHSGSSYQTPKGLTMTPESSKAEKSTYQDQEKLSLLNAIQKTKQIISGENSKKTNISGLKQHEDPHGNWQPDEIKLFKNLMKQISIKPDLVSSEFPKEFEAIKQVLSQQDFSNPWIDVMLRHLIGNVSQNQWSMKLVLAKKVSDYIESKIKVSDVFSRRAVALLGPTGVGKTTTIAKLAARFKLKKNKNIALITLDNYRIAATEQLKVYANILDVPVYVCKDTEKLKNIFVEDNADLFLIDTAGISQKNSELMLRQDEMLKALDYDIEKHLVISANIKPEDAQEVASAFDLLKFEKMIISKLDETNRFGHIIELGDKLQKPFSFFTYGQRVPDDHRMADARYLANKVLDKWLKKN